MAFDNIQVLINPHRYLEQLRQELAAIGVEVAPRDMLYANAAVTRRNHDSLTTLAQRARLAREIRYAFERAGVHI